MLSALNKFKTVIDSKKFVISLFALVLLIALFFIPFYSYIGYPDGPDGEPSDVHFSLYDDAKLIRPHDHSYCWSEMLHNHIMIFHKKNITWGSIGIAVYFTALIFAVVIAVISRKKNILALYSIPIILLCSYFIAYYLSAYSSIGREIKLSAAFYIVLIAAALYLIYVALALITKYKPRPPKDKTSRPPKPHKPTKAERIAELEKQVAILTNKKDTD